MILVEWPINCYFATFFIKKISICFILLKDLFVFAIEMNWLWKTLRDMKRFYFDLFSRQALSELHRYRAVMFSPTRVLSLKHVHFLFKH